MREGAVQTESRRRARRHLFQVAVAVKLLYRMWLWMGCCVFCKPRELFRVTPPAAKVRKRASAIVPRVNRRCDERLLETVRLGVVAPGLAASEEWGGCAI